MADASDLAPLTPPAAELTIAPPQPVPVVETVKAGGMVPIAAEALPGLDRLIEGYVSGLADIDIRSPEFTKKAEAIRTMGDADIRAAAAVANQLLDTPVKAMGKGGFSGGAKVSSTLVDLRRTLEGLDPTHAEGPRKLLGIIPFGNKLRDYFDRYRSAQSHIDAILHALYNGQDELRHDNAALEQEKQHLWETMERLAQYSYVAEKLDAAIVQQIAAIDATDPDRAKVMREDLLFYARQKHQDLLTQLAVSIQGYLAIDLVKKNNIELIKGVDRATTTTIAALRTAVIVAQALADQKLVLDQITALNTTTSDLIESTSKLLATQSVTIHEQAASSTIGIDKLEAAFTNIYTTMDAIDTFKLQALDAMATTVTSLKGQIDKAQSYVERARRSPSDDGAGSRSPSGDITLPDGR